MAVKEELLNISSLNTSVNSADVSFDIGNVSLASLHNISISDLMRPVMADVPSASSNGVTALQLLECTQLVESESAKVDVFNGLTASTSQQTGDVCGNSSEHSCWHSHSIYSSRLSATTCQVRAQAKKASFILSNKQRTHRIYHITKENNGAETGSNDLSQPDDKR